MTDTPNISWFAVRCAPNTEFRVLHALNQWDRPSLLPTEEKWIRKPNGKTDTKKFPMFASYVFGGFTGSGLNAWADFCEVRRLINRASELAGKAPPIIGVAGCGKKPSPLLASEISALEAISKPAGRHPDEILFVAGQKIRIVEHPLLGEADAQILAIRKGDAGRIIIRAILDRAGGKITVDVQPSNVAAA